MKVEHLTGGVGFEPGVEAWNRLLQRSATDVPFLTWQFQTTWWEHLGEGRLHVLVARDAAGEWAGIVPLYAVASDQGSVLRLVGGVDVADYLDSIASTAEAVELWTGVLAALGETGWHRLDLRPIPAASPTPAALGEAARAADLDHRVEHLDVCPVVDLPATWEAYLQTLAGKDRHELRRKLRRAEQARPRVEVARAPADVARLMDVFLTLHRSSKGGKARFMDARMEGFFREMAGRLAAAGWVALWLLWLEDRPAAAVVCFEYGDTVGLYNSGFDPQLQTWSPGVVLIARTIEDAIARGYRRYDFLRGDEPYKYGFGARPREIVQVTVERPGSAGLDRHP